MLRLLGKRTYRHLFQYGRLVIVIGLSGVKFGLYVIVTNDKQTWMKENEE